MLGLMSVEAQRSVERIGQNWSCQKENKATSAAQLSAAAAAASTCHRQQGGTWREGLPSSSSRSSRPRVNKYTEGTRREEAVRTFTSVI